MQRGEASGSVVDVEEEKEGRERKARDWRTGDVRGRALSPDWIPWWSLWVRAEESSVHA
jgi:hypothetical protein